MGHLNVMHYAAKFAEATWQVFAAIGLTATHLRQNSLVIAAVRQETTYRRELLPGDGLTIRSAIIEMSSLRIRFYHEMINDEPGEMAAATRITGVLLEAQTRKPVPLPTEVLRRGRAFIMDLPMLV